MGEIKRPPSTSNSSRCYNDRWHKDMLQFHAARLQRLADIGFDRVRIRRAQGRGASELEHVLSCNHDNDPYCIEVAKRATRKYSDFISDLDDALNILESYVLTLDDQCEEIRDRSHLERNDFVMPASDGDPAPGTGDILDNAIPYIPTELLSRKHDD